MDTECGGAVTSWQETPSADLALPPGTAGLWAWVPAGVICEDLTAGWRLFDAHHYPGTALTVAWDDASPAQLEALAAEALGVPVQGLVAMHSDWVMPGDADDSGHAAPVYAVIRVVSVEDAA